MDFIWLVPVSGLIAVLVAAFLAWDVIRRDQGPEEMRAVAAKIYEGATAFLNRQYRTIAVLAIVGAIAIAALLGGIRTSQESPEAGLNLAWRTGVAFIFGAFCSGLAGFIGMIIAVRANLRTAAAARTSLGEAMTIALRGGAVSGLLVVALSLLGVFFLFELYGGVSNQINGVPVAPSLIVGFGFGASFVALFAQLGGGIYTKAADVGADLVGKVEAGIPEDDPRNPAVIADLVGDNVGDCAGRGADLFESTAAENIGAMILGVAIYVGLTSSGTPRSRPRCGSSSPWWCAPSASSPPSSASSPSAPATCATPQRALDIGYYVTAALSVVGMFVATQFMLGNLWFFWCGVVGILTSIAFVYITQYYTSGSWRPVQEIANASRTGPATNIIAGLAVGLENTALPAIAISIALFASYQLGLQAAPSLGLARRSRLGGDLRHRHRHHGDADERRLHPGHGHLRAHHGQRRRDRGDERPAGLGAPRHGRPGLRGQHHQGPHQGLRHRLRRPGRLPALLRLPGRGAPDPGRRRGRGGQPRGHPRLHRRLPGGHPGLRLLLPGHPRRGQGRRGHDRGSAAPVPRRPRDHGRHLRPDYRQCVDISTRAALREMVLPGVLAVAAPVVVGLLLRWEAAAAFLMVGTMSGVLLATVLNNGGGAWDNAKKFIESGQLKDPVTGKTLGKGSEAHAAAVVGDTVGDPCKDTAGPSLHVLIKLLSTITLVLAPLFI